MTAVPHVLANGDFAQTWNDPGLITADDDWSGVPSIVGYRGDDITSVVGADPQALTGDGAVTADVNANRTNPNGLTAGGVAEFALADPAVALQGSGAADAPSLVLFLDATGRRDVTVSYRLRDLEDGADNAVQAVALQYRIGPAGAWTNVPAAFVADATAGPGSSGPDIRVRAVLPAAADGQAGLQVRIITANAAGSDEWVGVDDIAVTSQAAGPVPAAPTLLDPAPSLAGAADAPVGTGSLVVTRLGAIEASGTNGAEGGAEVVSFDPATAQLFTLNARDGRIDVTRIGADGALTRTGSIALGDLPGFGTANTVAVRNGVVAVGYQNADPRQNGAVAFFDARSLAALRAPLTVGNQPDQLSFNQDGTKIVVANEGERATVAGTAVNPSGSVSLVDLSAGLAGASVATYDFASLAGQEAALRAAGMRLPPGAGAVADIEPEYTAISGTTAYVTLQEANTVAVFDIAGAAPVLKALKPLGAIDRSLPGNELDASDDGAPTPAAIRIRSEPVFGLPMPDAIATFTAPDGRVYVVTANEGDARSDDSDVARLATRSLDPTAFPDTATLKQKSELGRLNVSTIDGDTDGDGDLDRIYTFGGRGLSIFRQEADGTITKVRETGGEFEKIIARDFPALFNQNQGNGQVDDRSDDKGPEPEGVTIGTVAGRTYAFVGLERVGGVMVYDVTVPAEAAFVAYQPPAAGRTDAGPEVLTFIAAADSPTGQALLVTANEVGNTTTVYQLAPPQTAISRIQASGDASPLAGRTVTTSGIVTAVAGNGFYLQDPTGDGDAATSDGIFVFTGGQPPAAVGDAVEVSGEVREFVPARAARGALPVTEIAGSVTVTVRSSGNALPEAVRIGGPGGLAPPTEDLAAGSAFWESLEGMRATVAAPLATGPTNAFGEIFAVADGRAGATGLNPDGNLLIRGGESVLGAANSRGGDFNPERIRLDPGLGVTLPKVNTGARLGDVTGIVTYSFGSYEVVATSPVTVTAPSPRVKTGGRLAGDADHLLVASYNAENLDPTDGAARFAAIASEVLGRLNTPDVIALQEVQDDDGPGNTASTVTSAGRTFRLVVEAIRAAGGPDYAFIDNPYIGDDTNGGEPGGNIRTAFLYRTDRVSLAPNAVRSIAPDGSPITAGPSADQQTNPDNPFYASRPPLAADFVFNDETVTVVSNHFTSKGGSGALFGSEQPPFDAGQLARAAQAQAVNSFVDGILAASPRARVLVAGDLNDFGFEEPLSVLKGEATLAGYTRAGTGVTFTRGGTAVLSDLQDTLPEGQRYDYVFEGNSETLDHVLVTDALAAGVQFEPVHINADFFDQTSDHDPLLARLAIPVVGRLLTGTAAGDTLTGGAGEDTILGGAGNDFASGRSGNDSVSGEAGDDLVFGDEGDDVVDGGEDNDRVSGGAGADRVFGSAGSDLVFGEQGDDVVGAGEGNDFASGGAGNDSVSGEAGDDYVFGDEGDDQLSGGEGRDSLYGGLGNDVLTGDAGHDVLLGEQDDDQLIGGDGDDSLDGGDGADLLCGNDGADGLWGGAGKDQLYGGAGADTLDGGDGADTLFGNEGADWMAGQAGDDALVGGDGSDSLFGGDGNDWLVGEAGDDALVGGQGSDSLFGGVGNDWLAGEGGDDLLIGGEGNDSLFGGAGADWLEGQAGDDALVGGEGDDVLRGGEGNDWLDGEAGNDVLVGGAGNDGLRGGDGADWLVGEAGSDTLSGGAGDDVLFGGAGSDTVQYASGDGRDVVRDFVTGGAERDVIAFGPGLFGSFAAVQAATQQVGADAVITAGVGESLTLQNIQASSLSARNFTFA
ncbi:Endonuclease/exonuclease/phosphatase [Methylobacterium sp. 4-46]|uniref:choice-of-anchor I family protein n=1 Tax=unclassified Methylobacterium TaxID=2615210 RepID=UPI000152C55D|nr:MULTISPECIES: choice-of-anchor I family protein [Methylobacterium]ACA16190.1 Endonuclease/exonuclease/phosphatase [Methylobacterium sp. 4-46]WFT81898.1 choice-of-anchor I family protein [Methylobacterium nodulans]